MITNVHVIAHNQEQVDYLNKLWFDSDFKPSRKGNGKAGFIANPPSFPIVAYMGIGDLMFGWDLLLTRSRNCGLDIEFDEYKRRVDINKKPTRTEYVKVENSIFDLKAEFEAGELYSLCGDKEQIKTLTLLGACFDIGELYRKVEREVTWRDEVEKEFPLHFGSGKVSMTRLFSDEELKEMCYKVYHLTK